MPSSAFGVDVGGTFAKIAAVSESGEILRLESVPSDVRRGPAAFVERLERLLQGWRRRGLAARALGFAVAGDVDHERGRLRHTPNLPGWEGFLFRDALRRRLKMPVTMDNDANAAVWGVYTTEFKRRPRQLIGLTLGTGVGGGLVVDGRLLRGSTGTAGEIGHVRAVNAGRLCRCGGRGCLEAYAGAYGILRTARALLRSASGGRILRRLCPDPRGLTPRLLKDAADQGDTLAAEVWRRTGAVLGEVLADAVILLNPDALVLLGGVSGAGRWLLDPVRAAFKQRPFDTALKAVSLRCAVNPDGGCVGAALLALEER